MNKSLESIIMNSCEYTPFYLIPSTSVTQAGPFIITQSDQEVHKPVADNLKTFYENSGKLESGILSSPKPRILKKQNTPVVGNNLKVASFLLPKSENNANVQNTSNIATIPSIQPKKLLTPVTNVLLKPLVTAVPAASVVTAVEKPQNEDSHVPIKPLVEIDRKIVRVGTIPKVRVKSYPRAISHQIASKCKPKEKITERNEIQKEPIQSNKHTSVQLIKLGETYHSLNQLSEDQMKIVNKALKMFSDPEKIPQEEAAYDPVTNTKFIYKVVSPRDLAVVGRNKVAMKKKNEMKRMNAKLANATASHKSEATTKYNDINRSKLARVVFPPANNEETDTPAQLLKKKNEIKRNKAANVAPDEEIETVTEVMKKKRSKLAYYTTGDDEIEIPPEFTKKKNEVKKNKYAGVAITADDDDDEPETPPEPKVTRSGRTVKQPKPMRPTGLANQKPRRKVDSVVNCFQCSAEFCSFYRLQRHYEMYPTHIPARIHSNMFHCLLAIIKGGSEEDQANIFVQQIEQLIEKIKSLWPCLLKKMDGKTSKLCTINEDISRLFGVSPGKYNINIDALNCVKDKDGHCIHNPAPRNLMNSETTSKPIILRNNKHNEEILNEAETEDCARINSVDKWPTVNKRIWKLKKQQQTLNAKKMRLASETSDEHQIELGVDEPPTDVQNVNIENSAINNENNIVTDKEEIAIVNDDQPTADLPSTDAAVDNVEKPKNHVQFHSTHFDIRSSPIKLPSSLVRKFQLNPDKVSNYEVQILRPLALELDNTVNQTQNDCDIQVFIDNTSLPKETQPVNNEMTMSTNKGWTIPPNEESEDSYLKANLFFETGLTPEKNSTLESLLLHENDKQNYLLETPNKSNSLSETNILHVSDKQNGFIEPLVIPDNNKDNNFYESHQSLVLEKENANGFYEPGVHVKPKSNTLIGSSVINLKALSSVKERSNNLFGTSTLQHSDNDKSSNEIEPSLLNSLFDTSLLHMKDRSSLFESSLLEIKDKELLDPSMLQDDNSNLFTPKENGIIGQSLVDHKSHNFDESILNTKGDISNSVNIDVSESNNLGSNDSRLLSNQGQSMLNFLDSLGNESLGLAYPETEIRNNAVDFQLDLFSMHD